MRWYLPQRLGTKSLDEVIRRNLPTRSARVIQDVGNALSQSIKSSARQDAWPPAIGQYKPLNRMEV